MRFGLGNDASERTARTARSDSVLTRVDEADGMHADCIVAASAAELVEQGET